LFYSQDWIELICGRQVLFLKCVIFAFNIKLLIFNIKNSCLIFVQSSGDQGCTGFAECVQHLSTKLSTAFVHKPRKALLAVACRISERVNG
jgi:hypothetical protein